MLATNSALTPTPVSSLAFGFVLLALMAILEPSDSQLLSGLRDQCGCSRMLYKPERETRRLKLLNKCLEKFAGGRQFPGVDAVSNTSCATAAIQGFVNLQRFANFMGQLPADERRNVDICYYTYLGYRNKNGSANAEAVIADVEAAVKEDPGIISEELKGKMVNKAKNECDRADMKDFYKCVYQVCFGRGRFPDI